eukprot:3605281-Alexandrium_andersonii.AAC.1
MPYGSLSKHRRPARDQEASGHGPRNPSGGTPVSGRCWRYRFPHERASSGRALRGLRKTPPE